jgi:hypothetical protein
MAAPSTSGADFASRWDSQQERYLPDREERFALMLDFVAAAVGGSNLRLLDLCCGTGSISKRAVGRCPDASIVAVDKRSRGSRARSTRPWRSGRMARRRLAEPALGGSEYPIKRLDASTWDAFTGLAQRHSCMGFDGCWCTWFHSQDGRPASATTGPRVRTIASCVEWFQLPRGPDVPAPGDTLERWPKARAFAIRGDAAKRPTRYLNEGTG